MAIQVRYLSEDEIERDTELLLAEYEETAGEPVKLPIPVAEITTYHLALRLGFADLHETLGIPMLRGQPDILGAIWIDKEAVLIDQSLDPKKYPSMKGRYRFSVGHEIGHWRLHRSYLAKDANQASLFDATSDPTVICRSSQRKEPIESQADFYASCLLMPRSMVFAAWRERVGNLQPISLVALRKKEMQILTSEIVARGRLVMERRAKDDAMLDWVARPFAKDFIVSPIAMRIRLEKLGLLHREVPRQRTLARVA